MHQSSESHGSESHGHGCVPAKVLPWDTSYHL